MGDWKTMLPPIFQDCVATAPSHYAIMVPFIRGTEGRLMGCASGAD